MLFSISSKKLAGQNNIGGALPLGWWSGSEVVLKIGGFAAKMGVGLLYTPS